MKLREIYRLGMDFSFGLTALVVAVLIIALIYLNEVSKKTAETEGLNPQGSLVFELYWPDELDADVDLWVRSSYDDVPVGYSNLSGGILNLLRDDLGVAGDISGKNMEITYSRGAPDGEYVVNAHMFSLKSVKPPIPVTLVISNRSTTTGKLQQIYKVTGNLTFNGEELTMARFEMKDGTPVPNSFNTIPEVIRSKVVNGGPGN